LATIYGVVPPQIWTTTNIQLQVESSSGTLTSVRSTLGGSLESNTRFICAGCKNVYMVLQNVKSAPSLTNGRRQLKQTTSQSFIGTFLALNVHSNSSTLAPVDLGAINELVEKMAAETGLVITVTKVENSGVGGTVLDEDELAKARREQALLDAANAALEEKMQKQYAADAAKTATAAASLAILAAEQAAAISLSAQQHRIIQLENDLLEAKRLALKDEEKDNGVVSSETHAEMIAAIVVLTTVLFLCGGALLFIYSSKKTREKDNHGGAVGGVDAKSVFRIESFAPIRRNA
jgi:hypothetical protein